MPISPPNRYQNLQGIMDQFRSMVNDDSSGIDGPQGGIIATNNAPFSLVYLNSAISDLFADLRTIGDPALILDNYLVQGLPAITVPNPAVQVSLGFLSYFDGYQNNPQWTLPSGLMSVMAVWERAAANGNFTPLTAAAGGLAPRYQSGRMGQYEWRGNAMWMPGCTQSVDLRIRCTITLPDFQGSAIDFTSTSIPIFNCRNVIVDKMLVNYARRFAPEQAPMASSAADSSLSRLQKEIVRSSQFMENRRTDFGVEATQNFAGWTSDL